MRTVAVLGAFLLGFDAARPPSAQVGARSSIALIHGYQNTLSRLFAATGQRCRFAPTCSHYTEAAIRRLGLWPGAALGARRILRCGPWTPAGTYDPPPGAFEPRRDRDNVQ